VGNDEASARVVHRVQAAQWTAVRVWSLVFFPARKQYPVRFSPTPSNCNLQLRTWFFA